MVKLIATQGADEANHGQVRYRVDNNGAIDVPEEAAGPLMKIGGFVLANKETPIAAGFVRVARADGSGASFGGIFYEANPDGEIIVPAHAAVELAAHGFLPVGETVAQVQARLVGVLPNAAPDGDIIMVGQPGASVSWGGASYSADDDGLVIVPLGAAEDLRSHGFVVAVTKAAEPVKAPAEVKPESAVQAVAVVEEAETLAADDAEATAKA